MCTQLLILFDLIELIRSNYFDGKLGAEMEIFHFAIR